MCGIVGIYGQDYVAQDIYDALITLQHRGQELPDCDFDGKFHVRKFRIGQRGFHTRHMRKIDGYTGLDLQDMQQLHRSY